MRYAWAPAVVAAKAWSKLSEPAKSSTGDGDGEESLLRYLLTPGLPARHHAPGS
jgi:hypothetical protein